MRIIDKALINVAAMTCAFAVWATEGDGLKAPSADLTWARWHGRLSLGTSAPAWRASLSDLANAGLRVNAITVSGDYYFTGALFDRTSLGGLRATSSLIVGPRAQAAAGQPTLGAQGSGISIERRLLGASAATLATANADSSADQASIPYLGLGYTGLSLKGKWSFSADLGLVALNPGHVVRLGRVFGGGQTLDELLRDMRLAPILQMGVSYSF